MRSKLDDIPIYAMLSLLVVRIHILSIYLLFEIDKLWAADAGCKLISSTFHSIAGWVMVVLYWATGRLGVRLKTTDWKRLELSAFGNYICRASWKCWTWNPDMGASMAAPATTNNDSICRSHIINWGIYARSTMPLVETGNRSIGERCSLNDARRLHIGRKHSYTVVLECTM